MPGADGFSSSVDRDDVERTIHDAGGRLIAALPDVSAGDAFESLLYVVMR